MITIINYYLSFKTLSMILMCIKFSNKHSLICPIKVVNLYMISNIINFSSRFIIFFSKLYYGIIWVFPFLNICKYFIFKVIYSFYLSSLFLVHNAFKVIIFAFSNKLIIITIFKTFFKIFNLIFFIKYNFLLLSIWK
jgi:hypothetical protein